MIHQAAQQYSVLVLGGTAQGKLIAATLHAKGIAVLYCQRDHFSQNTFDYPTRLGGFSQRGQLSSEQGLAKLANNSGIGILVDATHPYACKMSQTAQVVMEELDLIGFSIIRPAWKSEPEDQWFEYSGWPELARKIAPYRRPFFTLGASALSNLEHKPKEQSWTIRTAQSDLRSSEPGLEIIESIGPFSQDSERKLFERYQFDVLITKNSGGPWVSSKLKVARELGIPVMMLRRPNKPRLAHCFETTEQICQAVLDRLEKEAS